MKSEIVTCLLLQMNNLYSIPLDKGFKILLDECFLDKIPDDVKEEDFKIYLKELVEIIKNNYS